MRTQQTASPKNDVLYNDHALSQLAQPSLHPFPVPSGPICPFPVIHLHRGSTVTTGGPFFSTPIYVCAGLRAGSMRLETKATV
ncbi:MAG: hypothetical protein FE78DRAFT_339220 [Acidomyces sp. 'richmondensis']|nr:MAG: hypothetical protein FE78DRAFT_339220 [Acidomyces sp. 'richmondensis']